MTTKAFTAGEAALRNVNFVNLLGEGSTLDVFPLAFEPHWILTSDAIGRILEPLKLNAETLQLWRGDSNRCRRSVGSILNGVAVMLADPWAIEGPEAKDFEDVAEQAAELSKSLRRLGLYAVRHGALIPDLDALAESMRRQSEAKHAERSKNDAALKKMTEASKEAYPHAFSDDRERERHVRSVLGLPLSENPGNIRFSRAVHYLCLLFEAVTGRTPTGSPSRVEEPEDDLAMSGECGQFIAGFFRELRIALPALKTGATASGLASELRGWVLCTRTFRYASRSADTRKTASGMQKRSRVDPKGTKLGSPGNDSDEQKRSRGPKHPTRAGSATTDGR